MSLDQILVLPTWAGSQYVFANEWYKRILFCFNHYEHNAFSGFKNKNRNFQYPKFLYKL